MTEVTGSVQCGGCGAILADETPYDKEREPCPDCGSRLRSIAMEVTDELKIYEKFEIKQKETGRKKPAHEQMFGDDYTHKTGEFSKKTRIIDRRNDWYYELVTDRNTGEVLHECAEPLSEHFGHGSDKSNRLHLSHDHIAVAAYFIWKKAGEPSGRHEEHWFRAIEELGNGSKVGAKL